MLIATEKTGRQAEELTMSDTDKPQPPLVELLAGNVLDRLKPGNLGVVAARAGVGKSACLIQIALAELLRERSVLHVALDRPVAEVRSLYQRLWGAAGAANLLDAGDTQRMAMESRRHIHSYQQQGFTALKLGEAIQFLGDIMDFRPQCVVLDGFPFELASAEAVTELKSLAVSAEVALWFSALTHRQDPVDPDTGLPAPLFAFASQLSVALQLEPDGSQIPLRLLRDPSQSVPTTLPIWLDPTTHLLLPTP